MSQVFIRNCPFLFVCLVRSGQVRSECLTCTFKASCCSARLSRAQVPEFARCYVRDRCVFEVYFPVKGVVGWELICSTMSTALVQTSFHILIHGSMYNYHSACFDLFLDKHPLIGMAIRLHVFKNFQ